MPKKGKVVKEVQKDCTVTKTVIKENPFGLFPTLSKAIRAWIAANKDRRILRSRFTTVKGNLRNKHHRAVNIMHVAADVTDAEIKDDPCDKCGKFPCECPVICEKCGKTPCECLPE